jgi:hypothetical protein
MKLPEDLMPDITPRTMYKYHTAIRKHLGINGDGKQIRHIALNAVGEVVMVMDDPADLINVNGSHGTLFPSSVGTVADDDSCDVPATGNACGSA